VDTLPDLIRGAAARIDSFVRRTPLERADSESVDADLYFKLENFQVTGSFKARGALNKLLCLSASSRADGVVAASSGNHGMAVAYGARKLGISASIFVPTGADQGKVESIRRLGGQVRLVGDDCAETEALARLEAAAKELPYISPYNDMDVIAGQGTIGFEICEDLPVVDAVLVALGGGGLISGIASSVKSVHPNAQIIACSPRNSPAMHTCMEAGQFLDVPCGPTLSDATAGGVEPGSVTLDLCRRSVDRSLLISEDDIALAVRDLVGQHKILVEGAAGAVLAGYRQLSEELRGKSVVLLLCGANISLKNLREVIG
jgi:threonine dehydratase